MMIMMMKIMMMMMMIMVMKIMMMVDHDDDDNVDGRQVMIMTVVVPDIAVYVVHFDVVIGSLRL
jgi:hypothetical protein